MIPDFISAIYLWIIGKIGRPHPVWRSWLVPACLFILFVGISILFMTAGKTAQDEPPPAAAIEYQIEIGILKSRMATAEANILALAGTINELVVAINRIEPAPSLGNLATKGELELLRLEIATWQKTLDTAELIHDRALTTLRLDLDELKQAVEELEEAVTTHTDNTTIHKE